MSFEGREEVLSALREIERLKQGKQVPEGDFYAHVDFQLVVTYMGRLPVEYSAEGYVATDRVEDLQPAVVSTYGKIAETKTVFTALDEQCKEKGNYNESTGHEFDSEKEDYEQGLD